EESFSRDAQRSAPLRVAAKPSHSRKCCHTHAANGAPWIGEERKRRPSFVATGVSCGRVLRLPDGVESARPFEVAVWPVLCVPTRRAGPVADAFTPREKAVRKLLVTSQKGGVGKTTTSMNLAAATAMAGARVLLLDADPLSS